MSNHKIGTNGWAADLRRWISRQNDITLELERSHIEIKALMKKTDARIEASEQRMEQNEREFKARSGQNEKAIEELRTLNRAVAKWLAWHISSPTAHVPRSDKPPEMP